MRPLFICKNILVTLAFIIAFILCYTSFLNYYFDYEGFELYDKSTYFIVLSVMISLFPVCFYRGFKALSSFISLFIYVLLYVPTILTFAMGSNLPIFHILIVQFVFMLCMCMLFLSDIVIIKKTFSFKKYNVFKIIFFLTIATSAYVVFIYRNNLRLVGFADVYIQRASNEDLGKSAITGYLSAWLTNFMAPSCLAYGVIGRKYLYFLVGAVACLVLYMATASKGTILLPFIYLAFSVLFAKNRINKIYTIFVLSLTLLMTSMLFFTELNIVSAVVLSRTVGNGGVLTMWYYNFFLTHPYTYYSHINIINFFTGIYPYKAGLGLTVGNYFWDDTMDANANFWATDGVAAFGLAGVIIISTISCLIFIIINTITRGYNKLFVILSFIPFIGSLLNTSIFSSLVTGGTIFVIIFFFFQKREESIFDIKDNLNTPVTYSDGQL